MQYDIEEPSSPLELVIRRLGDRGYRLPHDRYACPACGASGLAITADGPGLQIVCRTECATGAILKALDLEGLDLSSPPPVKGRGKGIGEGRGLIEESVSYYPPFTDQGKQGNQPELLDLLERQRQGLLSPRPVRLGALPVDATDDMVRVALDLEELIGLRAAVFEDRPLPYSTTLCASRMGWGTNYARASRTLRKLESLGVIECVGSMPPRPGVRFGTKLYAPPAVVAAEGERPSLQRVDDVRRAS